MHWQVGLKFFLIPNEKTHQRVCVIATTLLFLTFMQCVLPHFPRFNHTSNQGSTYFPKTKETSPNSRRKHGDINATSTQRSHSETHRCDLCCYLSRSAQCVWRLITRFCTYEKNTVFLTTYKQMPELHITLYRICLLPYPFPLIIHYHPTIWHCLSCVV